MNSVYEACRVKGYFMTITCNHANHLNSLLITIPELPSFFNYMFISSVNQDSIPHFTNFSGVANP